MVRLGNRSYHTWGLLSVNLNKGKLLKLITLYEFKWIFEANSVRMIIVKINGGIFGGTRTF